VTYATSGRRWRETGKVTAFDLDLYGCLRDTKLLIEPFRNGAHHLLAAPYALLRNQDVAAARDDPRSHGPYVQIMGSLYTGDAANGSLYRLYGNAGGHGFEEDVHGSDKNAPRTPQNEKANQERNHRVGGDYSGDGHDDT